jgi:hypothetical protein
MSIHKEEQCQRVEQQQFMAEKYRRTTPLYYYIKESVGIVMRG